MGLKTIIGGASTVLCLAIIYDLGILDLFFIAGSVASVYREFAVNPFRVAVRNLLKDMIEDSMFEDMSGVLFAFQPKWAWGYVDSGDGLPFVSAPRAEWLLKHAQIHLPFRGGDGHVRACDVDGPGAIAFTDVTSWIRPRTRRRRSEARMLMAVRIRMVTRRWRAEPAQSHFTSPLSDRGFTSGYHSRT